MEKHQLLYIIWGGGSLLIVGSWLRIVSEKIGWYGFGIAGLATVISWMS